MSSLRTLVFVIGVTLPWSAVALAGDSDGLLEHPAGIQSRFSTVGDAVP